MALKNILDDPILRVKFSNFLDGEYAIENLLFIDEVDRYTRHGTDDMKQDIVKTFIVNNAPYEINIPSKIKQKIILDNGGFSEAYNHIVVLLESDKVPRFKTTISKRGKSRPLRYCSLL